MILADLAYEANHLVGGALASESTLEGESLASSDSEELISGRPSAGWLWLCSS